ncbi:MAG: hypothetical protein Tsb006_3250 [Rickettsiaceae bacterium]
MLLERTPIYIVLSICLATIYALFSIKENVMSLRAELLEVNSQIEHEFDTIHLLKAELAYLTSPARLKQLNEEYVRLSDTAIAQMDVDPISQDSKTKIHKIANNKISSKNTRWRYKKGPSKYLTMAAGKK